MIRHDFRSIFENARSDKRAEWRDKSDPLVFDLSMLPDKPRPDSPELTLAFAVLEQAITDALRSPTIFEHKPHHTTDALDWFDPNDDGSDFWPFSFRNLCAVFDLDPHAVREAVEHRRSGGDYLNRYRKRTSRSRAA